MICLLHRRHFNSTPPGTNRANMLPHRQRKGFTSGWSWPGLSWPFCLNIAFFISQGFMVFSSHPHGRRHKCQQHQRLSRQRLHRGVYSQERELKRKTHGRTWNPSGSLQLLDPVAGKNKSHNIKESPGGSEKVFQGDAHAELENRENHYEQSRKAGCKTPDHCSTAVFIL